MKIVCNNKQLHNTPHALYNLKNNNKKHLKMTSIKNNIYLTSVAILERLTNLNYVTQFVALSKHT